MGFMGVYSNMDYIFGSCRFCRNAMKRVKYQYGSIHRGLKCYGWRFRVHKLGILNTSLVSVINWLMCIFSEAREHIRKGFKLLLENESTGTRRRDLHVTDHHAIGRLGRFCNRPASMQTVSSNNTEQTILCFLLIWCPLLLEKLRSAPLRSILL